jgi:D-beta-D-heptose 7-phosphate kinase/D-beta-D-heptose 1-phosphate adenosyltransferase
VLKIVRREDRCGGAASVAADILALGAGVSCFGIVGADAAGEDLLRLLGSQGGETSSLVRLPGRPTTTKERLVGLAQHRHQQQMMRVDDEIADGVDRAILASLRSAIRGRLSGCKALAIEDYDKGVICPTMTPQIIADARAAGVPILVDPARIDDYSRYRGCTLLTPNRQEAQTAAGVEIVDERSLELCAERIIDAAQSEGVLITLDKEGSYLKRRGQAGQRFCAQARRVYEISGAGDVVLAMLCVALAGGADWDTAAALGNVAGGLEVERFGAVPIKREEILERLAFEKRQQHGKVVSLSTLMSEVKRLREAGKRIVWTNGCFDIMHAGHAQYLNFARRQGDALIVGVNSDASIRANKGEGRPIVGQEDRAEVLAALECVDYVVIFDDPTPLDMIRAICPDVLVKGADWKGAVVGQEEVEQAGGKVVLADILPNRSTTGIINRIVDLHKSGGPKARPHKSKKAEGGG